MGTAACGELYQGRGKKYEEGAADHSSHQHIGVGEWEESGMKLSLEEKVRGIHCPTFVHRAFQHGR